MQISQRLRDRAEEKAREMLQTGGSKSEVCEEDGSGASFLLVRDEASSDMRIMTLLKFDLDGVTFRLAVDF